MAFSAADLIQTMMGYFRIGGPAGVRLKNSSGNLLVRNPGDSADAEVTAAKVNVSGETIIINSDAAGAGADWAYNLTRPTSGMTAAVTLTLPPDDGTANQVLQTDGSGNLSWASAGSTAACISVDTTTVAFNSSSPVTMFTLPANAVVERVRVVVDTAFDATGPAALTVGKSGTTAKYMGSGDSDLTATGVYEVCPGVEPLGSTEALIVTFSAGSGGAAGSARVEVEYTIPA